MSSISDNVFVFVPTSPSPWNPSTDFMVETINGIWGLLGEQVPINIYCDYPAPYNNEEDISNYVEYCKQLISMEVGPVQLFDHWVGLTGLFQSMLKFTDKPLILNVQHDWRFIEPERVDSSKLVECMLNEDTPVKYVRFHKRRVSYREAGRYAPQFEELPKPWNMPLLASNGWGDSPHLALKSHYLECVLPHISNKFQRHGGRYGLEGPIWITYRRHIAKEGFKEAHAVWGSYLYGNEGDGAYIRHLGGDARKWRSDRGAA